MAYQLLVITWSSDDRFIENWVAGNQGQWSVDQYAMLPHLKMPPAKTGFLWGSTFQNVEFIIWTPCHFHLAWPTVGNRQDTDVPCLS